MISLNVLFWTYVILFAIIGAARGWSKEILVTASVILSVFIITLLESYLPFVDDLVGTSYFWLRAGVVGLLVFFGYQTPNFRPLAGPRFVRERFQDILLGMIIGGVNGYLVIGTLWFYMHESGYPFAPYLASPSLNDPLGRAAIEMIQRLPPAFLAPPWIYFATALAFLFLVIVLI
ncbi:MAG: hypothetical protein IBX69_03345 [Anaerolineales bacterium]|nr:hypothetical protein [Anaerolineales bacterium]